MTATTTATTTQHTDHADRWTARYTWHVPEGSSHPEHTERTYGSETAAIDAAVRTLDNQQPDTTLKVIRAEVRGPGGEWRPVEWRP